MLLRFEAAGIAISFEQVSHEAQTNIEPASDLSLRAFAVPIRLNYSGSNVFGIGSHNILNPFSGSLRQCRGEY